MVDRESLRIFLALDRAGSDGVAAAMDVLEPLFRIAESGSWPLKRVVDDESALLDAYRAALKPTANVQIHRVEAIETVSLDAIMNRAESFTVLDYLDEEADLAPAIYMSFAAEFDFESASAIDCCLRSSLLAHLSQAEVVRRPISEEFPRIWSGVSDMLFFYAGLVRAGADIDRLRLEPVIRSLPATLPIGFCSGHTGTFRVATR